MGLTREQFSPLIPHVGAMCLLDEVMEWDDSHIICLSRTHRNAANPLRRNGSLHAVCGAEYASQAMAIHGALVAPAGAALRRGYLAALRRVEIAVESLDDITGDLHIRTDRVMGNGSGFTYEFLITADGKVLLRGHALVFLNGEQGGAEQLPGGSH